MSLPHVNTDGFPEYEKAVSADCCLQLQWNI